MSGQTGMTEPHRAGIDNDQADEEPGMTVGEVFEALRRHWLLLALGPLVAGGLAFGITMRSEEHTLNSSHVVTSRMPSSA